MEKLENLIFTTSHKPKKKQIEKAIDLADKYNGKYKNRRHLNKYLDDKNNCFFVVEDDLTLKYVYDDQTLFYHPSISKIKMNNTLSNKSNDFLFKAIEPKDSYSVLDLTLGLGSEALYIANFVNDVTAVEGSFYIFLVVKESIKNYQFKERWMKEASEKIDIHYSNYKAYLIDLEKNRYDIIYCDPMFEKPNYLSSSLNPIRKIALYEKINYEDILNMASKTKEKVIVKYQKNDSSINNEWFDNILGSKNNNILYGVKYKI